MLLAFERKLVDQLWAHEKYFLEELHAKFLQAHFLNLEPRLLDQPDLHLIQLIVVALELLILIGIDLIVIADHGLRH